MRQLTREQQAVSLFQNSYQQVRNVFDTKENLCEFFDAMEGAISSFMLSELNYRQSDRCVALNVYPDYAKHTVAEGKTYNESGINTLKLSLAPLKEAVNDKDVTLSIKPDKEFVTQLKSTAVKLKQQIAYMEIKGSDAKELSAVVDELVEYFSKVTSEKEIFGFFEAKTKELIKVRSSKTRGADTNIAFWKLIAAGAIIGVGFLLIWKCTYSRWGCSARERAIYN
ncbi:MAG: hypothetical protein EAY81_00995, partial [Bacteroidetes bacterium]